MKQKERKKHWSLNSNENINITYKKLLHEITSINISAYL